MALADDLIPLIERIQPKTLLEVGPPGDRLLDGICAERSIEYYGNTPEDILRGTPKIRFDLAIVHLSPATPESKSSIAPLIGLLKNYLCDCISVLSDKTDDPFADYYLALGFIREKTPNQIPYLRYSYNLESYNRKRTWNNPRFWANPEHWHKRF